MKRLLISVILIAALFALYFSLQTESTIIVTDGATSTLSPYPPKDVPGAINTAITQANLSKTLCNPSWSTKSIRPTSSYTTALKLRQMTQYGLKGSAADYEEDHLISLELGGNPTSPQNLWPEPYNIPNGARQKDQTENFLHRQICNGSLTLAQAQHEISHDWVAVYKTLKAPAVGALTSDPDDEI